MRNERWKRVCILVKERDGQQCIQCGAETDLTVDHIKPIDLLTVDEWDDELQYDPDNLVTLCRPCNSRKGNRLNVRPTWVNRRWLERI